MAQAAPPPRPLKSIFTPEEAERALPLVRAITADLVAGFRRLRLAGRERRALEQAPQRAAGPGHAALVDAVRLSRAALPASSAPRG